MTSKISTPVLVAALTLLTPAQAARIGSCFDRGTAVARWSLPALFREVSGLAMSDDGRLFLHNDERGVIGALDPATGRMLGTYQLGRQPPIADFEGIAIANGRLFLTTSDGVLYETALPAKGATTGVLEFTMTETGVGRECEVEGLAYEPADQVLLLACKNPRVKKLRDVAAIYRWSPAKKALAAPDHIEVSLKELSSGHHGRGFHTSGIERDPASGHYLMIAGPDQAIAEVDRTGKVLGAWELKGKHPQAEGIAVGPNGEVLVSDEGAKTAGTVTVYACR